MVTGSSHLEDALLVRRSVFQEEQGISMEDDFDGKDSDATHFIGYVQGRPIATARVRYIGERAKIERVAVMKDWRGRRHGVNLIKSVLEELQSKESVTEAYLESQSHAKHFYERLGFKQLGSEFDDVGIPHVAMVKQL